MLAPKWSGPVRGTGRLGIRVLDLTRVIAGPVATRFLAGLSANVLCIDPPQWDEPGVVLDVTLRKRCARLDLRRSAEGEKGTGHLSGESPRRTMCACSVSVRLRTNGDYRPVPI